MAQAGMALMAVAAAVACAGCYGSTEAATNVNLSGATLNGFGTTDADTSVFFEYWPSAYPARRRETLHRDVQAGVTGPFRQFAPQLALDTEYSFRLCGEEEGGEAVCAQTRTFRMPTPAGDAVVGEVPSVYGFRPLELNAQSSPSGASPTGSLAIRGAFLGTVTAMQVIGNRAAVYAKGRAFQGASTFNAEACAEVVDGGPDAPPETGDYASADFALTDFGQTVGPCTPPPSDAGGGHDGVSVYDAPAG